MPRLLRLLVVEDSEQDAQLVLRKLARAGFKVSHERVDTREALEEALEREWDIVLSDFSMPRFDGLQAFAIVKAHSPRVPFIFVSGVLGEERAVEAMRTGAKDYVLKDKLDRLGAIVSRELAAAENYRKRNEAELALKTEQHRYESIFESAAVALLEVDFSEVKAMIDALPADKRGTQLAENEFLVRIAAERARIVAANEAALRLMDAKSLGDILGPLSRVLHRGSTPVWLEVMRALAATGEMFQREVRIKTLADRHIDALMAFRVPSSAAGFHTVVLSMLDVSERNNLENQMRMAQRMEAVGKLAGGVAHDFNNVLTVISSYATFVMEALPPGDPMRDDVTEIRQAAQRAEGLTRQLLAFSRRQVAELRVLDINQLVRDMDKMLRRLIGEDIDLETTLEDDLASVEIDPSHVEQIIMNLAVNARDAMPRGGKLTLETSNVILDAGYVAAKPAHMEPGEYVMLAMSDDGAGMDSETQQRAFEPFYTTKEAGQGTGLGLSTVYGIVKQARGFVWIYSEVGHGTTVKIHLPRTDKPNSLVPAHKATTAALGGNETILLVEDEAPVRRAAERILSLAGYTVLLACNGDEALELYRRHTGPIDAMVTDIVMPTMGGSELVERLSSVRSEIRVLYMSGYTNNAIAHHGTLERGVVLLRKPFTPKMLLSKLRDVLDAPRSKDSKDK